MDTNLEPPSPAPSPDPSGLGQMIGHNAVASFARSGPTTRKHAGVAPQPHTPYGSSPAHHGMGYFRSTTPAYSLRADGAHVPYSTPETSPAIALQTNGPRTRSTARLSKAGELNSIHSKGNRVAKPPPKKRKERAKACKRANIVFSPLSELARHYPDVAIANIGSYVNRPAEVRLQEVAQGKIPGKIKRPMNAFMLYRKAYQNLAKALCTEENHQVVSKVCGEGWPLEPESVREQFNQWARTERENHHDAHPNYKFTPSKPAKKAKKAGNESDDASMLDDPDWTPSRVPRQSVDRGNGRYGQVACAGRQPPTIFEAYHPYGSPNIGLSPPPSHHMYQYSTLGKPMPAPYDNTGLVGAHYYQQNIHHPIAGRGALVEDAIVRDTPSPGAYAGGEQDVYHGQPSQYPPIGQHSAPEQAIDPSLVAAGPEGVRYDAFYGGFGLEDAQWQGQQDMPGPGAPGLQESMAPLDNVLAQDPQLGYLRGDDHSWQVEEIEGHNPQFDGWPA